MFQFSLCFALLCWSAEVHLLTAANAPSATRCQSIEGAPSCVCNSPKGVIDLTKVASFDGTARFAGLVDHNGFVFDYNPCVPFVKSKDMKNSHIIERNSSYAIADYGTEQIWIDNGSFPYVHYTGAENREVFVQLVCDPSALEPMVATIGGSDHTYHFTLRSFYACPLGNVPPPAPGLCEPVEFAPSCVCRTPSGVIDLTKIAFYNNTARFSVHNSDYIYSYNPCFPVVSRTCTYVHSCQTHTKDGFDVIVAGYGSEQMMIGNDGEIYVYYMGIQSRETFVHLICDKSKKDPILETTGDSKTKLKYEFSLTSCHACPGGC